MDALVQRMQATELAVGDFRQTLTAQAQNSDAVRTLLESLSGQVTQVMAAHDRLHRDLADRSNTFASSFGSRRTPINTKDLKLGVLGEASGGGYRQQWAEWSDKAKDFMAIRIPEPADLRKQLTTLESQKEAMTDAEIETVGLDAAAVAEMRFFLKNYTTSFPYDQLTSLGDAHPLEMWRTLAQSCDPLSHEGNFTDSQHLHNPPRSRSYDDLPMQVASWKKSLERWSARTGEKLAETTKREALLRMCPSELELEMRKSRGLSFTFFSLLPIMIKFFIKYVPHY